MKSRSGIAPTAAVLLQTAGLGAEQFGGFRPSPRCAANCDLGFVTSWPNLCAIDLNQCSCTSRKVLDTYTCYVNAACSASEAQEAFWFFQTFCARYNIALE
ncbi:hypothetical protein B0H63DRAFT_451474 [Podospora didyma]|uniref:CFEM domain-containing protein n=1 Tax=Podospora didyma TaxID=330526 RepID=A0AAE0KJW1_9PEZI|nr:hypothetical protein B0H63DRAFT_451474 [Podospora didyma]